VGLEAVAGRAEGEPARSSEGKARSGNRSDDGLAQLMAADESKAFAGRGSAIQELIASSCIGMEQPGAQQAGAIRGGLQRVWVSHQSLIEQGRDHRFKDGSGGWRKAPYLAWRP